MNDPLPVEETKQAPGFDSVTCRNCGHVFSRKFGSCPKCGTPRPHRRPKKHRQQLKDRIEENLKLAWKTIRRYRWFIIYIGGGILVGAGTYPTVMWLAEFSMPSGWRESRFYTPGPWSIGHFLEPFGAAAQTLARWSVQGFFWVVEQLRDHIWEEMIRRPSTMLMIIIGATIGTILALRRQRRRRRHRSRSRTGSSRIEGSP